MAECKKRVGQGVITYPCVVEIPEGRIEHDGPCMAVEDQGSVQRRERWDRGGDARAVLAATQSRPLTFSQANPANAASPVPGSRLQPAEYREQHRPVVGGFGEQAPDSDCLHPFGSTVEDEVTHAIFCRACGRQLRAPMQPVVKPESTLGAFVEASAKSPGDHPAGPLTDGTEVEFMAEGELHHGRIVPVQEGWSIPEGHYAIQRDDLSTWAAIPTSIKGDSSEPPEPTKQREGDQPLPAESNPRPAVQDLIIEAMQESKRVGTERYGQPLKPMNGRDTFQDAQEEARDFYVYLTALVEERREMQARAERAYFSVTDPGNPFKFPDDLVEDLRLLVLWLRGTPQT